MKKNLIPRCYFIGNEDDGGVAVVALNGKDAKKIVMRSGNYSCEFIDLRVTLMRDVDISGFQVGQTIPNKEGYKRGIYFAMGDDDTCECCGGKGDFCEDCKNECASKNVEEMA